MQYSELPELLRQALEAVLKTGVPETPVLLCSKELLKFNLEFFRQHVVVDKIIFPVKVNHDRQILSLLSSCGTAFEIASVNELKLLQELNIDSREILFSNPVRIPSHIQAAYHAGVRLFAVDRLSEIDRLAERAASSKTYLRLSVANTGAAWLLDNKFGTDEKNALNLMSVARKKNLQTVGLSFHVGWCNQNIATWKNALNMALQIAEKASEKGIFLEFINIGGGFPAHNVNQYQALKRIAKSINPLLVQAREQLGLKIWAEPGSFIAANSTVLLSRIIDISKRGSQSWAIIDAGVFQGFYWTLKGLKYKVIAPLKTNEKKQKRWIIAGPTNDSQDIFESAALLPANLREGDYLLVFPAGAYVSSAKEYNGFTYPETRLR